MSKETKNVELLKKISDQIWLHDLDDHTPEQAADRLRNHLKGTRK